MFQKQVRTDLSVSAKLLKDTHYFESVNIDTDEIDLSTDINELRVTWIDEDGTVLRVATNVQSLWSVFMSVAPIIALIILLIIAICVAISHMLTKQLLKPIEMMAENLPCRNLC